MHGYFGRLLVLCYKVVLGNVSVSVTLTKGVLGHDIFLCVGFYSTYFFFA